MQLQWVIKPVIQVNNQMLWRLELMLDKQVKDYVLLQWVMVLAM